MQDQSGYDIYADDGMHPTTPPRQVLQYYNHAFDLQQQNQQNLHHEERITAAQSGSTSTNAPPPAAIPANTDSRTSSTYQKKEPFPGAPLKPGSTLPSNPNLPTNPFLGKVGGMSMQHKVPLTHGSQMTGVYLGDLHWWTKDSDVSQVCAEIVRGSANDFKEVCISDHKCNGKSKGLAYIEARTPENANAIRDYFETHEFQSKRISVQLSYSCMGANPFRTLPKEPYNREPTAATVASAKRPLSQANGTSSSYSQSGVSTAPASRSSTITHTKPKTDQFIGTAPRYPSSSSAEVQTSTRRMSKTGTPLVATTPTAPTSSTPTAPTSPVNPMAVMQSMIAMGMIPFNAQPGAGVGVGAPRPGYGYPPHLQQQQQQQMMMNGYGNYGAPQGMGMAGPFAGGAGMGVGMGMGMGMGGGAVNPLYYSGGFGGVGPGDEFEEDGTRKRVRT